MPISTIDDGTVSYNDMPPMETNSNSVLKTSVQNLGEFLTYQAPAAALALYDTLGSNIGLDTDAHIDSLKQGWLGGAANFYRQHEMQSAIIGELPTMLIPGGLAVKALRGARTALAGTAAMASRPFVQALVNPATEVQLLRKLNIADKLLAKRAGSLAPNLNTTRRALGVQHKVSAVGNAVADGVAFELGVAATMNQSEFLYPADMEMSDHLLWASLGVVLPGGFEYVAARKAQTNSLRNAAKYASEFRNPLSLPVNAFARPGGKDLNITIAALSKKDINEQLKTLPSTQSRAENLVGFAPGELNAEARKTANAITLEVDNQRKKLIESMKKDGLVYKDGERETREFIGKQPLNAGETELLNKIIDDDPFMFLGSAVMQSLDEVNPNFIGAKLLEVSKLEAYRAKRLQKKLKKQADAQGISITEMPGYEDIAKHHTKADQLRQLQTIVFEPTGEVITSGKRSGRFYDNSTNGTVTRKPARDKEMGNYHATYRKGMQISSMTMDDSGLLYIAGNTKPLSRENSHIYDMLASEDQGAVFAMIQRAREEFDPEKAKLNIHGPFVLKDNAHWTQLQFAHDLIEANPALRETFLATGDFKSLDALKFEIFAQKAAGMAKDFNKVETGLAAKLTRTMEPHDIFYKYDMPQQGIDGTAHPLAELILTTAAAEKLRTYDEFKAYFKDWNYVKQFIADDAAGDLGGRITPDMMVKININGNATRIPGLTGATGKGQTLKPIVLIKNPVNATDKTRESLDAFMSQRKMEVAQGLLQHAPKGSRPDFDSGASFVGELTRMAYDQSYAGSATSAFMGASKVDALFEFDRFLGGAAQQRVHAFQDVEPIAALHQFNNFYDSRTFSMIAQIYDKQRIFTSGKTQSATAVFGALRSKGNEASNTMFNMYVQARRNGWALEAAPAPAEGNATGWVFKLAKSDREGAANLKLWNKFFSDEEIGSVDDLPDFMPNMAAGFERGGGYKYQPLVVDDLALDAAEVFQQLGSTVFTNSNVLRKQLGLRELNFREWWIPPKNLTPTPGNYTTMILPGPGEEYGHMLSAPTEAKLRELVKEEISRYKAAGYEHAMEVPNKQLARYADLQDRTFANLVDMSDNLNVSGGNRGLQGTRTLETGPVFENMIDAINRQFNSISRRTRGLLFEDKLQFARNMSRAAGEAPGRRTIYNQYANMIMGGAEVLPDSTVGKVYGTVESTLDTFLGSVWEKVGQVRASVANKSIQAAGAEAQMKKMRETMGEYMPFDNAMQFIERSINVKPPVAMRNILPVLNELTSTLTLRLMELGHPILNLTSLGSTLPSVTSGLKRLPDETNEQWANRIGAWGSVLSDDVAIIHPVKLFSSVIQEMFSNLQYQKAIDDAADFGYFKQAVAETVKTLVKPHENLTASKLRAATEMLSKASDVSEVWSRKFAHMAGYYIADKNIKMTTESAKHVFAHKFANDVIGDYHPANKPQIFQGTMGMPIGLFQTFMWNYFHRLFNYVGNRQYRTLATQYATQAAFFGAQTVPGFQQYNDIFAQNSDGTVNPVDNVRSAFGPAFGDLFFYGSLSNLPKILPGVDDGIALYTRGDANVTRIPNILTPSQTAPARLIESTYTIIKEQIDQFRAGGQFSAQQTAEIVGRYFINRPIRNLFEIAAGASTDRYGQVVSNDVRNGLSLAARFLGTKPLTEAKATEANYRIRSAELSQRAIRERMRDATRSASRGGGISAEFVEEALTDYVKSGGNPAYFGRWLQDQLLTSKMTRTQQQYMDFIKDETRAADLARLMNMGLTDAPEF